MMAVAIQWVYELIAEWITNGWVFHHHNIAVSRRRLCSFAHMCRFYLWRALCVLPDSQAMTAEENHALVS